MSVSLIFQQKNISLHRKNDAKDQFNKNMTYPEVANINFITDL